MRNIIDVALISASLILSIKSLEIIGYSQVYTKGFLFFLKFGQIINLHELFNTFLGAALAFLFALFLYLFQRKSNDGSYLSYAISYFTAQSNGLYSLKEQALQDRQNEISKLQGQFQKIGQANIKLELREISKHLTNYSFASNEINLEKLSFLSDYDPNLIILIKTCLNANHGVDQIIEACNLQIQTTKECFDDDKKSLNEIDLLMKQNINLIEQVDYALFLLEKTQEVLIDFSKYEFKHFVKITGIEKN